MQDNDNAGDAVTDVQRRISRRRQSFPVAAMAIRRNDGIDGFLGVIEWGMDEGQELTPALLDRALKDVETLMSEVRRWRRGRALERQEALVAFQRRLEGGPAFFHKTREQVLSRVGDLLRRTGVEDAEHLIQAIERGWLPEPTTRRRR